MMKKHLLIGLIASTLSSSLWAASTSTLIGFAKLDVETYAEGPTSGSAVKGANGIFPPFKAQPVQGFSGALKNEDGSYTVLADNGFGTQDNSADFLLRIYHIKPEFRTASGGSGKVDVLNFVQLRDPNKLIPFDIVNQKSDDRLLTGADFDPESIQRAADGSFWVGEEFGPFLLHFDKDGVLIDAPIPLPNPYQQDQELRSPQNQLNAKNTIDPLVQQSGGFEGMALSKDGKFLYPMLEKPLKGAEKKQLIISQFDIEKKAYTGKYYLFDLDEKADAIGDFQLIDNETGIIIERDNAENSKAVYKKLILVKLGESGQTIQREDLVDLMAIQNPDNLYGPVREGDLGTANPFTFPFFTIEDVIIEDAETLTVLNDNNFPGSSGRNAKLADDNEIIKLKLSKKLY